MDQERGELPTGLTIRPLNKVQLLQELQSLLNPLNRSLGSIELCSQLSLDTFYGIAKDLREIIQPELWPVAELDGKVVGFAGAFPDLSSGFRKASGSAGIADIDFLKELLDRTKTGFLAWLAVDPDAAELNIGRHLLSRLYDEMAARGFEETILSWEMRDGRQRSEDFYPPVRAIRERLEYTIFRKS